MAGLAPAAQTNAAAELDGRLLASHGETKAENFVQSVAHFLPPGLTGWLVVNLFTRGRARIWPRRRRLPRSAAQAFRDWPRRASVHPCRRFSRAAHPDNRTPARRPAMRFRIRWSTPASPAPLSPAGWSSSPID